jgi:hypothetical protein
MRRLGPSPSRCPTWLDSRAGRSLATYTFEAIEIIGFQKHKSVG